MVRVTGRKNIVICIGGLMAIRSAIAPMHRRYANCVRRKRKSTAIRVMVSAAPEAICVWMTCTIFGKRTRSV